MASTMKAFSKDLNIDDSLSTDGVDSELSLAEDDLLDVCSGTLAFFWRTAQEHKPEFRTIGRSTSFVVTRELVAVAHTL